MKKEHLYIVGALASIVALIYILKKQSNVVQVPQVGRVGTAPGVDTTPQELAFKSSIFSTYANYLGLQDTNKSALEKLKVQSTSAESLARLAAENSQNLAVIGGQNNNALAQIQGDFATQLARINADADLAKTNILASNANAGELLALQYQNDAIRRSQSAQARQSTLDSLLKGLGQLFGGQQSRPSSSGGVGSGGAQARTPDFNPNARTGSNAQAAAAARARVQQYLNQIRINNYNQPLSFLDYPDLGFPQFMDYPQLPSIDFNWPNIFGDGGDFWSDYPTVSFPDSGGGSFGVGSFPEFSWDVDSYGGWLNFDQYGWEEGVDSFYA